MSSWGSKGGMRVGGVTLGTIWAWSKEERSCLVVGGVVVWV